MPKRRWRRERALPYLLMAPALALLAGMLYPFGLGLYYSMTNYWLQYPKRFRFVWFDNYINLMTEPLFAKALQFTLGFTLVAVVVQVGLGLAVALFLHARIPGRTVLRALMLLPLMMPPVITALMWKIMMASTNAGILNYMLSFIGVNPVNWFGSTQGAVVSILIIDHAVQEVMDISDRVAVFEFGRLLAEGLPHEIRTNPEVLRAYFGTADMTQIRKVAAT